MICILTEIIRDFSLLRMVKKWKENEKEQNKKKHLHFLKKNSKS